MNRQNQKSRWQTFYIPAKGHRDAGVKDRYGRIYMVHADGSLRLVKDATSKTIK
jgi:hypothetical protein